MGWGGIKNGDLLERAGAQGFNALITIDGGMEGEQNLNGAPLTIVVMAAHPNHLQDLQPLVPRVVSLLADNPGKSLVRVRAETGNAR